MVFFALLNNIPVNSTDIKSKGQKFVCLDKKCKSDLIFVKNHKRSDGSSVCSHY